MKRRLILLLKLVIAVLVVVWLLSRGLVDFKPLASVGERWPWLVAAQLFFAFVLILAACRWRLLLRAHGVRYSLWQVYSLTLIGWVFNQLMLGTVGGDMVKAYMVAREQAGRRSAAAMSVLVDRALGLFVLLLVALTTAVLNWSTVSDSASLVVIAWSVLGLFSAALVAGGLYFFTPVGRIAPARWLLSRLPFQDLLARVHEAVYHYKYHPGKLTVAVFLSVGLQTCVVLTNLCLARALIAEPLPWQSFFLLVPVAHVIMALPVNPPAAMGTAEAIYGELFLLVGISQGALICILQRATALVWALIGCIFYVQRRGKVAMAVEDARHDDERSAPTTNVSATALEGEPQECEASSS